MKSVEACNFYSVEQHKSIKIGFFGKKHKVCQGFWGKIQLAKESQNTRPKVVLRFGYFGKKACLH